MAAVLVYPYTNKKRRSNLTNHFVDSKIAVREKGKWYIVCLFKVADLEGSVAGPDTQQFNFALQTLITFNSAKHLIDRGSLPLTEGSVHTKYLNDNDIGLYFWNGEGLFADDPQIFLVIIIFRY